MNGGQAAPRRLAEVGFGGRVVLIRWYWVLLAGGCCGDDWVVGLALLAGRRGLCRVRRLAWHSRAGPVG